MLKSFINKALKAALNELFTNAGDGVSLSMGADLFTDSNLNLSSLIIRPDLFDVMLQPLRLVSGHVGSLKLEGIAEMAFGGKLRLSADNIYLLFQIDESMDAERSQVLKKLLLELHANNSSLPQLLLREILKKIQGYTANTKPTGSKEGLGGDVKKKRRLLIKGLNYLFSNVVVFCNKVHIRFELPSKVDKQCFAFGVTLPQLKVIPYNPNIANQATRPASYMGMDMGGSTPQLSLFLKGLQMYCDYTCTSYTTSVNSQSSKISKSDIILQEFKSRWSTEAHTAMLLPVDLEIALAIELRKRTGLLSLKIATDLNNLRIACDPKQLEVLSEFLDRYVAAKKRQENLLRVRGIFGRKFPPPIINEVGGITVLPHLLISGQQYPQSGSIPKAKSATTIITLLKSRLGPNWAKALWRHAYKLVLDDLRRQKPFRRWVELIKLCWARKQYAFIYSRLLRRSKETGNFVVNVNAKVDVSVTLKLLDLELTHPVSTIFLFRSLAVMINFVELLNSKRKQSIKTNTSSSTFFERTNIPWKTILRIHSEMIENQRLTAFHKSERLSPDDDGMTDAGDMDDNASTTASDDAASTHSSTYRSSSVPKSPAVDKQFSFFNRPNSSTSSQPTPSSVVSSTGKSMFGTAKSVVSIQSAAVKMISHALTGGTTTGDELDNKFLSRSDLIAFSEWFALFETEDKAGDSAPPPHLPPVPANGNNNIAKTQKPSSSGNLAAAGQVNAPTASMPPPVAAPVIDPGITLRDIQLEVFDWQLGGDRPSDNAIIEGVQSIFAKDEHVITIVPPDFSFHFNHMECNLRYPLDASTTITPPTSPNSTKKNSGSRKIMAALIARDVFANVIITHGSNSPLSPTSLSDRGHYNSGQSSSMLLSRNQRLDDTQLRSLQGFVSLMGSLIQLRMTVGNIEMSMHVHNDDLAKVLRGESVHFPESGSSSSQLNNNAAPKTSLTGANIDHEEDDEDYEDADEQDGAGSEYGGNKAISTLTDDKGGDWDELLTKYRPPDSFAAVSSPPVVATVEDSTEIVKILYTKPTDRFLVLCVLLDFDYKGEGAADVQLHIGDLFVDLDGSALAALVDEATLSNFNRIHSTMTTISTLLAESQNHLHLRNHFYQTPNMQSRSVGGNSSDQTKRVDKEAVLRLLNTEHWRSILDYILPRVVTASLRTSKIQADMFSASVIRNIVFTTFQDIANRASMNRQTKGEVNTIYARPTLFNLPPVLSLLQDLRRKATRANLDLANRIDRGRVTITSLEMSIHKNPELFSHPQGVSGAGFEMKGLGMEVSLPIDDDTLCAALSIFLAMYFPVY